MPRFVWAMGAGHFNASGVSCRDLCERWLVAEVPNGVVVRCYAISSLSILLDAHSNLRYLFVNLYFFTEMDSRNGRRFSTRPSTSVRLQVQSWICYDYEGKDYSTKIATRLKEASILPGDKVLSNKSGKGQMPILQVYVGVISGAEFEIPPLLLFHDAIAGAVQGLTSTVQ